MIKDKLHTGGPLTWILVLAVIGAFWFADAMYGWPHDVRAAGSFAEFVGALLSPITLILLVLSLNTQARAERRVADDNFLALQVNALIALLEDDRYKLASMAAEGKQAKGAFQAIVRRHRSRVKMLNQLVHRELKLPVSDDCDDETRDV